MVQNSYLIKAIESYPYSIEDTVESLNYALSYEPNNPMALCLMGRIYSEVYQDYDTAIQYFESSLAENVDFIVTHKPYITCLIKNEDYNKALRFIEYAMTVKSSNKGMLILKKSRVFECQFKFNKALDLIKKSKLYSTDNDFIEHLEKCKSRIKNKMSKAKNK